MWAFYLILSVVSGHLVILQSLHLIIASASNRSGATRVVAIGVMKTFDMVWPAALVKRLKFYEISVRGFDFIIAISQ